MGLETGRTQLDTGSSTTDARSRFYEESAEDLTSGGGSAPTPGMLPMRGLIPYGTEGAGLITLFKQGEDPAQSVEDEPSRFEAYHEELSEKSRALLEDRRFFGRKDSDEMTEVKTSIRALLSSLERNAGSNFETGMVSLKRIDTEYQRVIDACRGYIRHIEDVKGGRSGAGKARLGLVQDLLAQYFRERTVFVPTARKLLDEGTIFQRPWREVLREVRTETIDLSDGNTSLVGDGASLLYKRTGANGETDFIKAEEQLPQARNEAATVDAFLSEGGGHTAFGALIHAMEEYYEREILSSKEGKDKPPFRKVLQNICSNMYSTEHGYRDEAGNPEPDKFVDSARFAGEDAKTIVQNVVIKDPSLMMQWMAMNKLLSKKKTETGTATGKARIAFGSSVSDRSQSTSRLARRYGISNLFASSRTALLDQGDGTVTRANVMEQANGMSMTQLQELEKARRASGSPVEISYTPNSLMQMFTLQVFDLIAGQVDRHWGNYFLTIDQQILPGPPPVERWYIMSVTGIDNDLSFGNLDYDEIALANLKNVPLFDGETLAAAATREGGDKKLEEQIKDRQESAPERAADGVSPEWEKGHLAVYYLPKAFYERLINYTPNMAKLDLLDQRSTEELASLEQRITAVTALLRKYVERGDILLVDEDLDMSSLSPEEAMQTPLFQGYARSIAAYGNSMNRPYGTLDSVGEYVGAISRYIRW
ncbi:MAG: hypothetical protein K6A92_05240 [Lachnospiraceae bacterium]|nr:hypothetical protein [Lachnospiraceae bacterium]